MELRKNLIDIFKVVGNDEELLRLLYYPTDPLNQSKQDVKSLPDYADIRKERIMRSPKTDDITNKEICRVCVYFGNRNNGRSNSHFAHQDVVFDIYCHIDKYDSNDARSLWIADRLNGILHDEHITGFSKTKSDQMFIIGNPPSGYIGYKYIYEFVSENY
ncbi:hypothetical protein AF332_11235 [Sporosarcina globispora]|uniref:Uncharacterized protein n=1 Tax=Sporosarcina globispora TaxID=1459 RepID=A0A0M0GCS5_SPOGL|nr:hypothetical protein [Sporosarcina globispora]KON87342.1 hypothetical protein AF332_11235 [Sporosarcina globispora]